MRTPRIYLLVFALEGLRTMTHGRGLSGSVYAWIVDAT